jgi:hypothetical protein
MNNIIENIMAFCEIETRKLIAELEQERFGHQGAFNDHEKWANNASDVIKDKGRNQPLVDTGNLEKQLSTASNWDLKPVFKNNSLQLVVSDNEQFTDKKYDKLDKGGLSPAYTSPRGNRMRARNLPARPFKAFSDSDIDWITNKLVQAIQEKFN